LRDVISTTQQSIMILRGRVGADPVGPEGAGRFSGDRSSTWLRETHPASAARVAVAAAAAEPLPLGYRRPSRTRSPGASTNLTETR
jgi:hypothetical protein